MLDAFFQLFRQTDKNYRKYLTSWTCHVCKENRPDESISVWSTDLSEEHNLPPGTMTQNVRFCNDKPECIAAAPHLRLLKRAGRPVCGNMPTEPSELNTGESPATLDP